VNVVGFIDPVDLVWAYVERLCVVLIRTFILLIWNNGFMHIICSSQDEWMGLVICCNDYLFWFMINAMCDKSMI
jgi:hypothetical protein